MRLSFCWLLPLAASWACAIQNDAGDELDPTDEVTTPVTAAPGCCAENTNPTAPPPAKLADTPGCASDLAKNKTPRTVATFEACIKSLACTLGREPTLKEVLEATQLFSNGDGGDFFANCTESDASAQPATPPNDLRCISGDQRTPESTLWCSITLDGGAESGGTIECVDIGENDCGSNERDFKVGKLCTATSFEEAKDDAEAESGCQTCHSVKKDAAANGKPCKNFPKSGACPRSSAPPPVYITPGGMPDLCARLQDIINRPDSTEEERDNAAVLYDQLKCGKKK